MSLKIIRADLLNVKCDAIVNPSDIFLSGSGSIDKKVHEIGGNELANELKKTKNLEISSVVITKAYNFKSFKYIIHVAGPIYIDGKHNEFDNLRQSYRNILSLATKHKLGSISIPLISSGSFNFPKEEAFLLAREEINNFLIDNDIKINLVVYDEESFSISKKLESDVESFINDNLVVNDYSIIKSSNCYSYGLSYKVKCEKQLPPFELDESFSEAVLRIIDDKGLKDPDVYKKANLDRKLFSSLRSKKNYKPSKKTAIALCIALELSIDETDDLLRKAGFALSESNLFDVIIKYFITNGNYNLYDIDATLLKYDQQII